MSVLAQAQKAKKPIYLTMLYKYPGEVNLGADHGGGFDTAIVGSDDELKSKLADGWHRTPAEAKKAGDKAEKPVQASFGQQKHRG